MNKNDFENLFQLKTTIPQDWNIYQIKSIVSTKITDGPHETPELKEAGVPFISAEAIKNDKIDYNLRRGYISEELHKQYSKKCKPQKNDIFIIKSGATTGNVAYVDVDFEFNIWSPLALVRCKEYLVYFKFLYYQLLSDIFRKQVELSWSFGTQENIGMRVIERLRAIIPTLPEQRLIADYLDKTCASIDKAIETKKKQLETLDDLRKSIIHKAVTKGLDDSVELKDSGVEWIGLVPEHWVITVLKRTTYIKGRIGWQGLTSEEYRSEGKYLLVTGTDFDNGGIKWDGCWFVDEERYMEDPHIQLKQDDVLITKDGTIGKIALVENVPHKATLNSGVFVTRPLKNEYLQKYMYWVLKSDLFPEFIEYSKVGTTIAHLYQKTFERLTYPLPPVQEQQNFVLFLDKKIAELKKLEENIGVQIKSLQLYRKSLIHECVTGKRRITEKHLKEIEAHV